MRCSALLQDQIQLLLIVNRIRVELINLRKYLKIRLDICSVVGNY